MHRQRDYVITEIMGVLTFTACIGIHRILGVISIMDTRIDLILIEVIHQCISLINADYIEMT